MQSNSPLDIVSNAENASHPSKPESCKIGSNLQLIARFLAIAICLHFASHAKAGIYYEHCGEIWWQCNDSNWDHVPITLVFTVTQAFPDGAYQIGHTDQFGGFGFNGPQPVGAVLSFQS